MECPICEFLKSGKAKKIYEDELVVAFLNPNPAVPGHSLVVPKQHFVIIEQTPDFLVGKLFGVANTVSSALFRALNLQGTNILLNNGVSANQKIAHLAINVIPRTENDNLNFSWNPKQLNEEQMSTIELKIKEQAKNVGIFEKEEKKIIIDSKREKIEEKSKEAQKVTETSEKHIRKTDRKKDKNIEGEKECKDNNENEVKEEGFEEENYLLKQLRRIP
ncbi:MAG: HIT family protein [Candidatus Woesearchaeota archaeon]